jgi:hypothetical protein
MRLPSAAAREGKNSRTRFPPGGVPESKNRALLFLGVFLRSPIFHFVFLIAPMRGGKVTKGNPKMTTFDNFNNHPA